MNTLYTHVGEIGQRLTLTGIVDSKKLVWARGGRAKYLLALVRVRCDDAMILLFTKDEWENYTEAGEQITITGTVREHRLWHNENLTVLGNAKRPDWTIENQLARLRAEAWERVNGTESGPRPFPHQTDPLAPAAPPSPLHPQP